MMSTALGWLSPLLLATLLTWSGRGVLRGRPPVGGAGHRLVVHTLAGMVALHLTLLVLDLVHWSWQRWSLIPLLGLGFAAVGRANLTPPDRWRLSWGDVVALVAVATFTALAVTLWITTPDFFYHWGWKAARFFLARRVDYEALAAPWNGITHPGYPLLLPELYSMTAVLAGELRPAPLMLWSALFFGLLLLAVREALRQALLPIAVQQAATAIIAISIAAFAISGQAAGSADWLVALALAAAAPSLLRPPDRAGDYEIGVAAAVAAAAKVEGVALALLLVSVHLWRRRPLALRPHVWLSAGLPPLAVVLAWQARVHQFSLDLPFDDGGPTLERAAIAATAIAEAATSPGWHGMTALLLLLPLLLAVRSLRPLALVLGGQAGAYLWTYCSSPLDTRFLVLASFPRLYLQLFPALAVAAAALLLRDWGVARDQKLQEIPPMTRRPERSRVPNWGSSKSSPSSSSARSQRPSAKNEK